MRDHAPAHEAAEVRRRRRPRRRRPGRDRRLAGGGGPSTRGGAHSGSLTSLFGSLLALARLGSALASRRSRLFGRRLRLRSSASSAGAGFSAATAALDLRLALASRWPGATSALRRRRDAGFGGGRDGGTDAARFSASRARFSAQLLRRRIFSSSSGAILFASCVATASTASSGPSATMRAVAQRRRQPHALAGSAPRCGR